MTAADDSSAETPVEKLAREGAETYAELTQLAEQLPPERRQAMLAMRDLLTDAAARTVDHDRRLTETEQHRELIDAILGSDDMPRLAAILRNRLTAPQLAELHELTAP